MRFKKQQDWAHQEKSVLLCCYPPIPIRESFFVQSIPTTYSVTIKNVVRKSNSKVDTCQIFKNDTKPVSSATQKVIGLLKKCRKKRPKHSSHIFFCPIYARK